MKAWVTIYALTKGILEVEGDVEGAMLCYRTTPGERWAEYAHGKEWHRTLEGAKERAERMRQNKVESLRKPTVEIAGVDDQGRAGRIGMTRDELDAAIREVVGECEVRNAKSIAFKRWRRLYLAGMRKASMIAAADSLVIMTECNQLEKQL